VIAKITRGSSARGLAAYLHGPGRANEHAWRDEKTGRVRAGGRVIGGTVAGADKTSGRTWAREFEQAHRMNYAVAKQVWHCSLRAAASDRRLSDAEWARAGQLLAAHLGYGEHPWVMVRHAEDHVHIAVSRVNHLGAVWKGSHDWHKVRPVMREIERVFGLAAVPEQPQMAALKTKLTQNEHRRAQRLGVTPPRTELASRVRAARDLAAGRGRAAFEAELDLAGVAWRANVASTGRMNGYSFATAAVDKHGEPVWLAASKLDRTLAWKQLASALDGARRYPPHPSVPRKRLESKASHAARADAAGLEVHRRKVERGLEHERSWHAQYWAAVGEINPEKARADQERAQFAEARRRAIIANGGRDPFAPQDPTLTLPPPRPARRRRGPSIDRDRDRDRGRDGGYGM